MTNDPNKPNVSVKYYMMNVAHIIDVFRVIPRMMVSGYGYMVWTTVEWFQTLPEPTSQHTFLISTIVGGAAAVFGLYVNSGTKWDDAKSADPNLYIRTDGQGSEFGRPNNSRYQISPPPNPYEPPRRHDDRGYDEQYNDERYELELPPKRQPRRGASEVDDTPPEGYMQN